MTYTYIAPIITNITGIENVSVYLLLFGVGALIGNLLGGFFTDKVGAKKTLKTSLLGFGILLAAFSALMFLPEGNLAIILTSIVALLWGIPGFGMNPALNTYLISLKPEHASMILSFSASALYLGIGLGAVTGGVVISFSSTLFIGISSGFLLLISFIAFSIISLRVSN